MRTAPILGAIPLAAVTQPALAATITSLPGGTSANIPTTNENTAGPRLFGPGLVPTITSTVLKGAYLPTGLATGAGNNPLVYR